MGKETKAQSNGQRQRSIAYKRGGNTDNGMLQDRGKGMLGEKGNESKARRKVKKGSKKRDPNRLTMRHRKRNGRLLAPSADRNHVAVPAPQGSFRPQRRTRQEKIEK